MPGLIGRKIGMTSVFDENRRNIPCTILECGPCYVTQVKTTATDGYDAVQIGFDEKKEKNTSGPLKGHFKKAGIDPLRVLREFDFNPEEYQPGDAINPEDVFEAGEFIDVTGTSKGKGWQGVVKRHGFAGVGEATHGQHNRERSPGSIGGASFPGRVFKGMKMAGRMGGKLVNIENLQIVQIIPEKSLMVVSGAVPGAKGGIVFLEK